MRSLNILLAFPVLLLIATVTLAQSAQQPVYSDAQIAAMAGNVYGAQDLPLGDNRYTINEPKKGYIDLCHMVPMGGGAQHTGSWVHGDGWNPREKIAVQGHVGWPNATFSNVVQGDNRILSGNGLPTNHSTGIFPIQPNDPAAAIDRNPNSISAQDVREVLPLHPVYNDPPNCMGMEVGIMLDGVPLFGGFDAALRDAAAHEVQDSCDGHPERTGQYHYHSLSPCIKDASVKTVIGYALDGFPITGPMVTKDTYLTTSNLDVCHGLTSEVIEDGKPHTTYHYVMTFDFPYSASCFRGNPIRTGPAHQPSGGQQQGQQGQRQQSQGPQSQGPQDQGMQGGSQSGGMRQPPAEAINACEGKQDGGPCSFTSPRGDSITGSCHTPPAQSSLACVPAGMR